MDKLKLPENKNYTIGEVRGPTEIARKYKLHEEVRGPTEIARKVCGTNEIARKYKIHYRRSTWTN